MKAAVELRDLTMRFREVTAVRNADLTVREGSIHAIAGENGAGKSTLVKVIAGLLRPTAGTLSIRGEERSFSSAREAIRAGIGMVHQHFMLVGELTAAENIMLGFEQASLLSPFPKRKVRAMVSECAQSYGLEVDPDALCRELSVGEEQRLELLKLLIRNASIMILDEPTAVLTPQETEKLFQTLRALAAGGRTVILITHKLDEVLSVADTVSVMQKGRIVGTMPTAGVSRRQLAEMMVGRGVSLEVANPPHSPGETVLEARNLGLKTAKGAEKLSRLSFCVKAGEIYGIAGVEGNGQSELLGLLAGHRPPSSRIEGELLLEGVPIQGLTAQGITARGVSHVPEDRLRDAVVPEFPVSMNLVLGRHREAAFRFGPGFSREAIERNTAQLVPEFDIRVSAPDRQPLSSLSGGNQQKVVVAREMTRPGIRLLILAQPTRGVDIGAIESIHRKIIEARDRGTAILLVSSELEELTALSSRIGCIYRGTIRHEFNAPETEAGRRRGHQFHKEIGQHIT
ncbi:ABC transporter ATP-binding protein [Chlorobium sp. N1]|uniref:ABC transporter ATP-binding protein n=1 Tax=Chlorobium sp. N1 TaxID=2491138 RepID=UPI001F61C5DF|nr:ABC transporter ATP-binding protein [Chlorobium sp. N1]